MSRYTSILCCGMLLLAATACESSLNEPEGSFDAAPELTISAAPGGGGPEYEDVMNQGGVGVYASDGASLVRQPNGIQVRLRVPTPDPGSYVYAAGTEAGHPEVFTLWAFVFNYPENCTDPCNGDDLGGATGAIGGAYNAGGVISGGGSINVAGRIGVGESPFGGLPLELPATAEVHLALAPHGAMDPSTLPTELRTPEGSPACGCWWVAIFD